MREIDREEMKCIQLGILDYFSSFCEKNGLKWWLDFGTLIGAVRHKGFIPWDDDIDVSMLREDYEKLKKLFNERSKEETGGRYELLDPEINKDYSYPFGKIVDNSTLLLEGTNEVIEIGVYMDVFVFDSAPSDRGEYEKMLKKRKQIGKLRSVKLLDPEKVPASMRKAMLLSLKKILRPFSINSISCKLQKNAKKLYGIKTGKIADFLWPYDSFEFYLDDDFFDDQVSLDFEGRKYPGPARYDEWLRYNYGEYMQLPPEEKRVQHNVKAFLL